MAVACKYQKYRAKEQFINHDKEYDRIMVSCALTKSLCPALRNGSIRPECGQGKTMQKL